MMAAELNPQKRTYLPSEAAEVLHVHVDTVRRYMKQGTLPFFRVGISGHRRISFMSLEQFIVRYNSK